MLALIPPFLKYGLISEHATLTDDLHSNQKKTSFANSCEQSVVLPSTEVHSDFTGNQEIQFRLL